jgi:hypothetical protein
VDVRGRVHNNQPGGVNSFIVFFWKGSFFPKEKKVTFLAAVAC